MSHHLRDLSSAIRTFTHALDLIALTVFSVEARRILLEKYSYPSELATIKALDLAFRFPGNGLARVVKLPGGISREAVVLVAITAVAATVKGGHHGCCCKHYRRTSFDYGGRVIRSHLWPGKPSVIARTLGLRGHRERMGICVYAFTEMRSL